EDGARILAGGERPAALAEGNFLQATVIADVTEEMAVFREEIFGPVLVATPFDDEAEAIRLANATPYGLAAYVWTNDIRRAHRVAHAIDSGMTWINSQNVRDLRTPFGGVKQSGIGREGGDYAFDFYCETSVIQVALGTHHIPKLGMPDGN
ncbi:MAG TPA: aldehyde dehydrogenase family protein, partial [Solirubrobacterales bacterium]